MIDYLVVGLGLAGISFCEQLKKNGKSFQVVSDNSQQASIVAGGLYNPIILKRFTMAWEAKEQLDIAMPFYQALEKNFKIQLDYKIPVLRRFASIEEQNDWFIAADRLGLDFFLNPELVKNNNPEIDAPFGYGEVKYTGRIATKTLIKEYATYLKENKQLIEELFNHRLLRVFRDKVIYKGIQAKKIVFAEGFGLKSNPYFNYLPLTGTKGEYLIIVAPELKEESAIKANIFCIPEGKDTYRIGASYKWDDFANTPTKPVKEELINKLEDFITCKYKIVNHIAGIRPTVIDRRPLVGKHPKYGNLAILNGFGSRGVLIAPYASEQLYEYIETNKPLNLEMDISRFTKKYFQV